MAAVKSIKFLPSVFQTEANKKFLNATVDQLISEPSFKKVNGYIGRRFAPTFKKADNYVLEADKLRQDYQLEPSVVVTEKGNVLFHADYVDLLQKIEHYGGITTDHSRMFENEYYSFDGQIDLDKLVNFNQYYWLPTGPKEVDVFSSAVDAERTFDITINLQQNAFNVSGFGESPNPDITVVRGGKYKFLVNSATKFWVQTEPGLTGYRTIAPNIKTREVLGVENNGATIGEIEFFVPEFNAQQYYTNMPLLQHVDYATSIPFNEIHNTLLSAFLSKYPGFDGVTPNISGKELIFVSNDPNDNNWAGPGRFSLGYDPVEGMDAGQTIPSSQRTGIWRITLDTSDVVGSSDAVIKLVYVADLPVKHTVYVTGGSQFGNKEFFKSETLIIEEVPLLTSLMDTFYYSDSENTKLIGRIKVVDSTSSKLEVDDILGKPSYTSPNGVKFTNGLKVRFDDQVDPVKYANKVFYVEGVGSSIRLVDNSKLITPETNYSSETEPYDLYNFDTTRWDEVSNGPIIPDYVTINRSSIDLNAWSRSNRWFHQDVIAASAKYNNSLYNYNQLQRATRPIIEFEPDLKLFNNGRFSNNQVDILDFTITDSLNQIEGVTNPDGDFTFFGIQLSDGLTVVFANDVNPEMRNRVFAIRILDITQNSITLPTLHLELVDNPTILPNESVTPTVGHSIGKSYWYNGTIWVAAQQKHEVNQAPKFDIVDGLNNSFGDNNFYTNTTFAGTSLFEYAKGTGADDKVLGFPLRYRSFNNVGDIEFANTFNTDLFTYINGSILRNKQIIDGFAAKIDVNTHEIIKANMWSKVTHLSKQSQVFSYIYQGNSNFFELDVRPDIKSVNTVSSKVLINNKIIDKTLYDFVYVGVIPVLEINTTLFVDDKIDVIVYSKTPSEIGHYEVPVNLDMNSLNADFTSLTLGQMRNHLVTLSSNSSNIIGSVPGNSNLRDLQIKDQSGSILQHSAPVVYSSLFLLEKQLNFVSSITYAQKEYTKFKNRFLELSLTLKDSYIFDPVNGVDTILKSLNAVKTSSFPWFHSDMIPHGDLKNVIEYTVLSTAIVEYEMSQLFNDTALGNTAVLVYVNGEQLVKDEHFYFNQTRPSIVFNNELEYDDVIQIVEYSSTVGCYVPETPTKLGLYPKYVPVKFLDDTYVTPINVIRGHDGSITPAFNDFRDDLLLELEKRIYNNIKIHDKSVTELMSRVPGKFRDSAYSRTEFNQIVSKEFLRWAGDSKVDYTTNSFYVANNPWTWNYSSINDKLSQEKLPGHWRGIFRYFYDTETPNTTPWEMLGFSVKPTWWEEYYGPAPYTGGNLVLWEDLETGTIREGDRAGVDPRFARPGLLTVIPVTDNGLLKNPSEFLTGGFSGGNTDKSFVIGDVGPVEAAWRKSSDYPFALQTAIALMHPGCYFGLLMNVDSYFYDSEKEQYLIKNTNNRISPTRVQINGEVVDGEVVASAGYINWIRDYIVSLGILDPAAKIRQFLTNLDVKLSYKVGGYTDKTYTKFLAEQSSPSSVNESIIIPSDDYSIYLHKSPPIGRVTYSAVIVEKVGAGFVVKGYDLTAPYFTIVPSDQNSNNYTIGVLGSRAIVYNDFERVKVNIPYGTEFTSRQQVCDFLVSYGRYLTGVGFTFTDFNTDLQLQQDWALSVREFLTWAQQGWQDGALIVLTPLASTIKFSNGSAIVDEITNTPAGSKVMDQNFSIIKRNNLLVVRENNDFVVTATAGQSIAFLELNLVQYEHSVIFNNETMFNDVIYKPELGNRQYRLKCVGSKTDGWSGKFEAPGFIYSSPSFNEWAAGKDYLRGDLIRHKNSFYVALTNIVAADVFEQHNWAQIPDDQIKSGLLPNLATNAKKSEWLYDIDATHLSDDLERFSNGLIGFRNRNYLEDLSLDTASQVKLYQGFIKEKGTRNAVTALTKAEFNNLSGSIDYFEEWGIRVGEYGALSSNKELDIKLSDQYFTKDPIAMSFVATEDQRAVSITTKHCYKTPPIVDCYNVFKNRDSSSVYANDIKTAGYVSLEDVDLTIFDINDYSNLSTYINKIGSGFRIWTAKDQTREWNVYRITETENQTISVKYLTDDTAEVVTEFPHALKVNEIFAFKGIASLVDGFYQTISVKSINTVVVKLLMGDIALAEFKEKETLSGRAILYKMISLRFKQMSDIVDYTPIHNWKTIDKVWVDEASPNKNWGVFNKNEPWVSTEQYAVDESTAVNLDQYGTTIKLSSDAKFVMVSRPKVNSGQGEVKTYFRTVTPENTTANEIQTLSPVLPTTKDFGECIDMSDRFAIVSAPGTSTVAGEVYIYNRVSSGTLVLSQRIEQPANEKFGDSVSISGDSKWLYIGASEVNKVYSYKLEEIVEEQFILDDSSIYFDTNPMFSGETVPFLIANQQSTTITSDISTYLPGVHYTFTGNLLKFNVDPGAVQLKVTIRSFFKFDSTLDGANYGVQSLDAMYGVSIKTNYDGSKLIVGAPGEDAVDIATNIPIEHAGAAYVYGRTTSGFSLIKVLEPRKVVYNAQFGTSVDMSPDGKKMFVGSPYYTENSYKSGVVRYFADIAAEFNTITTVEQDPVLTPGGSIFINGVDVGIYIPTPTLDDFVNVINYSDIPGVTATNDNGYLTLTSVGKNSVLAILPGSGNLFNELSFNLIVELQEIKYPMAEFRSNELFGSAVKYDAISETLLCESKYADLVSQSVFDNKTTVFDNRTTYFYDRTHKSGSVYVFELMHNANNIYGNSSKFGYVQLLYNPDIKSYDQFGYSIDIAGHYIVTSAPYDDEGDSVDIGRVYSFTNLSKVKGWEKVKSESPKVDYNYVNELFVYNSDSNTILNYLDYIDPVKGKILGIAEQDIDYKTTVDPAAYNRTTNPSFALFNDYHWSDFQVGKVWWNLDLVRYVDYEQGSLSYRLANWGRVFPGSTIEVLEWVESDVLPSKYVEHGSDGIPKYEDDSAYVEMFYVHPVTNSLQSKYYFWVKDKKNNTSKDKSHPVAVIADIINNPQGQGIPYAAILSSSAVGLFNYNNMLNSDKTVLHIEFSEHLNKTPTHSEFELLQEGNYNAILPTKLVNKLVDSLTGKDTADRNVPDVTLKKSERYGISVRPRQSMFSDRTRAAQNFVTFVNNVFSKHPIAAQFNIQGLYRSDLPPSERDEVWNLKVADRDELEYINKYNLPHSGLFVGFGADKFGNYTFDTETPQEYKILVERDYEFDNLWTIYKVTVVWNGTEFVPSLVLDQIQSYDTSKMWKFVDWVKEGFNVTLMPTYTVDLEKDMYKLHLKAGDLVRVNNNGQGQFMVYGISSNLSKELKVLQNGTIELSSSLFSGAPDPFGFSSDFFDSGRFDLDVSKEFRCIFETIRDHIFVRNLSVEFNKLFFSLMNYSLAENRDNDWLFKTSFISIIHKLRKLEEFPNYIKDNQEYYRDYINEVKPYRTKIREYLLNYEALDDAVLETSDFDLPPYYDEDLKTYRSPNFEHARDEEIIKRDEYKFWRENYTSTIGEIVIQNQGVGYTIEPTVTLVGGNGIGAKARALIDYYTGAITQILVEDPGYGYTSIPQVIINGNGVGGKAYAMLSNNKIRSISSTIKFDRITYSSEITDWDKNSSYDVGSIVSFNGGAYIAEHAVSPTTYFDYTKFRLINPSEFTNANDRVMAYYNPKIGMPGKDLAQLFYGIEFPGNNVLGLPFSDGVDTGYPQDTVNTNIDTIIRSNLEDSALGVRPEDVTLSGNHFVDKYHSHAPEELVPGIVFDTLEMRVFTLTNHDYTLGYRIFHSMSARVNTPKCTFTGDGLQQEFPLIYGNGFSYSIRLLKKKVQNTENGLWATTSLDLTVPDVGEHFDLVLTSDDVSFGNTEYTIGLRLEPGRIIFDNVLGDDEIVEFSVYQNTMPKTYITSYRFVGDGSRDTYVIFNELEVIKITSSNDITVLDNSEFLFFNGKVLFNSAPEDGALIEVFMVPDVSDNREYYRISEAHTVNLAEPLHITDSEIVVSNTSMLPEPSKENLNPGVVFINGEKITYYEIDRLRNVLKQIRRAVSGTGAPTVHPYYSIVSDGSIEQRIPENPDVNTWLNPSQIGYVVDGQGLDFSSQPQAMFIKASPSYVPWLPSDDVIWVNPDMLTDRFSEKMFDEVPFDSYDPG